MLAASYHLITERRPANQVATIAHMGVRALVTARDGFPLGSRPRRFKLPRHLLRYAPRRPMQLRRGDEQLPPVLFGPPAYFGLVAPSSARQPVLLRRDDAIVLGDLRGVGDPRPQIRSLPHILRTPFAVSGDSDDLMTVALGPVTGLLVFRVDLDLSVSGPS